MNDSSPNHAFSTIGAGPSVSAALRAEAARLLTFRDSYIVVAISIDREVDLNSSMDQSLAYVIETVGYKPTEGEVVPKTDPVLLQRYSGECRFEEAIIQCDTEDALIGLADLVDRLPKSAYILDLSVSSWLEEPVESYRATVYYTEPSDRSAVSPDVGDR